MLASNSFRLRNEMNIFTVTPQHMITKSLLNNITHFNLLCILPGRVFSLSTTQFLLQVILQNWDHHGTSTNINIPFS